MNIGRIDGAQMQPQVQQNKPPVKPQEEQMPQDIVDIQSDAMNGDKKLHTYANPRNATNAQLWEQFTDFAGKQIGKQLSGLKSYLQGFIDASGTGNVDMEALEQRLLERYGLDADLDPANIEEDGPYSPDNLSDRLVQFARNISGDDASKADLLMNAVKKGFEVAERVWGDELPEISQRTYRLTMEKFDAWKNGELDAVEVEA